MSNANYRTFFYFHGLQLTQLSGQLKGTCPFCQKGEKFFVNSSNGQWDCKSASCPSNAEQQGGNHFTFLKRVLEFSLDCPKVQHNAFLQELSEERGISVATLKKSKICRHFITGDVLIPSFGGKSKGGLNNLYKAVLEEGKYIIKSSPAPCEQVLWRANTIGKRKLVYLCEGHWDAMVWVDTLAHLASRGGKMRLQGVPNYVESFKQAAIVAVPGATTFKDGWVKLLRNKDVVLLYDNDPAGEQGIKKVLKTLAATDFTGPNSLRVLLWKEGDPNDLRDLRKAAPNLLRVHTHVTDNLGELSVPTETQDIEEDVDPIHCPTFRELRSQCCKKLHWTQDMEYTLLCMLATILSTEARGGQLGLRVLGPPGSAKSTFAECLSKSMKYVLPKDTFTGIVSGWHSVKKEETMASRLNGKCLMIKEADALLQQPNLAQIESELRSGLGDGKIRAEYRTGKNYSIRTLFTAILCGTKTLRKIDNASLGSRFLDIVIHDAKTPTNRIVDMAMESQFQQIAESLANPSDDDTDETRGSIKFLAPYMVGFLDAKKELMTSSGLLLHPLTEDHHQRIKHLAKLVACCRAKVERGKNGDILYRPEKEIETRISEQLLRLAIFLSFCLQEELTKEITIVEEIFPILQKVAFDTAYGFQFDIVKILSNNPEGLDRTQISRSLKISSTQAQRILEDTRQLEMTTLIAVSNPHGNGRKGHYHILTKRIKEICEKVLPQKRSKPVKKSMKSSGHNGSPRYDKPVKGRKKKPAKKVYRKKQPAS